MKHLLIIFTFLFSLSCAQEPDNSQAGTNNKANKKKTHLLSDHEKALQKAKQVEKELKKADDKRRKALGDG